MRENAHKGMDPNPSSLRSEVCTVGCSLSSSRAAGDTAGSVPDYPSSATILLDGDPCYINPQESRTRHDLICWDCVLPCTASVPMLWGRIEYDCRKQGKWPLLGATDRLSLFPAAPAVACEVCASEGRSR